MKTNINPVVAVGVVILAALVIVFGAYRLVGRQSSAAEMASLTPKPIADSPTFQRGPDEIVIGGRGMPSGATAGTSGRGLPTSPVEASTTQTGGEYGK